MNQVGQVLNMFGTVMSGRKPYAWVWSFWDGETGATKYPVYQKAFNQGGTLTYSVRAVDESGAFTENSAVEIVNSPPEITELFVSNNDSPAPYSTAVRARITDPDDAGDLIVYFGDQGTIAPSGVEFYFEETIETARTILLSGTDQDGGITSIPLDFRIAPPPGIFLTGSTDTPIARIGVGQAIDVGALASEQYNAAITSFTWSLTTDNGWASDVVYFSGTNPATAISNLGGGAYQSSVEIPISSQSAGPKVIILTATTETGSKSINVPVTLIDNQAPIINDFEFSGTIVDGISASLGVDAEDVEGDVLSYTWSLTIPNTIVYGNPVSVIAEGSVFEGSITVSDSFGASITRVIPKILITSQLQVTAVQGSAFSYQLTTMGRGTITYTATNLPPGLSMDSNGLITGVPTLFGSVDVTVSAENNDGTDVRTLRIDILQEAPAPPPPENLLVNGSSNPSYTSGADLIVTFDLTNDIETLPDPSGELEMRDTQGTIFDTLQISILNSTDGSFTYTITNATLQSIYGGQPSLVIRAFAVRSGVRSQLYQEITVTRI